MAMDSRLSVSTTCPTCGAPLDFSEGSNAVQCGYCHSNLLVTGHRQILSYVITPKLDAKAAPTRVITAYQERGLACRIVTPHLYFVPYYHFVGHALRWDNGNQTPSLKLTEFTDYADRSWPRKIKHVVFTDRYVDRNFIACDVHNACPFSLGVRPSVMRLELFRQDHLLSHGHVAPLSMTPKDAIRQGVKAVDKLSILYRQILALNLSVIYFPYWLIEVESGGQHSLATIDAVTGTVSRLGTDPALLLALNRQPLSKHVVIGFRPLACPNCGWDLPLRPHDVIFFCDACDRAWEIYGQILRAVPYQFADLCNRHPDTEVIHLPFWVLTQQTDHERGKRYFLPAFRYRRLKLLADLAHRITSKQPTYGAREGSKPDAYGCYYDRHDALKFAGFIYVGIRTRKTRRFDLRHGEKLAFNNPTLTWIPFRKQDNYLVDPFTNLHLPEAGLI
jgi:DNA-directed RNA polymerase subunit RPC12/RpoP